MHQFFVEDGQIGREFITITGSDVNHIKNVLRMHPGETIRVSGQEKDYFGKILELTDTFVQVGIVDGNAPSTELSGKVFLFQGIPKGNRMETVIEKAVELGVFEIIPVDMRYCVVKLDEKKAAAKVKRWRKLAEAAAKQSKRSRIPNVHPVMDFREAAAYASDCDICLVPYENESGMDTAREAFASIRPGSSISVMIGPEGGFAPEEIDLVRDTMRLISLGRRILRTDTAGIAVLSMLMLTLEMG